MVQSLSFKHLALVVLFVSLCGFCNAQSGGYGEIFIGSAKQKDTGLSYGSDSSYGFWAGMPITDAIAAEIGYANYGGPTLTDGFDVFGVETTAVNLGARFQLPIDSRIGVHARFGIAFWDFELTGPGVSGSLDDSDFYWGLGADYRISESSSLVLDYYSLSCKASGVGSLDVTNFSLGIGFDF